MKRCSAFVVVAALAAGPAHAGNLDSYFFGDEAAMMAGAVTATVRSSEAAWYNPAGLGGVPRGRLDLTATGFALRIREVPDFVQIETPDGLSTQPFSDTGIFSVPTSLIFARNLSSTITGAAGLYLTNLDRFVGDAAMKVSSPSLGLDIRQAAELDVELYRMHFGLSLGWAILPRFRIGFAVNGVYDQTIRRARLWFAAENPTAPSTERVVLTSDRRQEVVRWGLEAVLGLQWEPADRWHIGLVVRSPVLNLKETVEADALTTRSAVGLGNTPTTELIYDPAPQQEAGFGRIAPTRIYLGVGYDWQQLRVSLEADVSPPLFEPHLGVDTRFLWNVRAGVRARLTPQFALGGGLFTDRSPNKLPETAASSQVDFYGLAFAVQFSTPVVLAKGEKADTLEFAITIGLRYAIGPGHMGTFKAVYKGTSHEDIELSQGAASRTSVLWHEIGAHIGSAIRF